MDLGIGLLLFTILYIVLWIYCLVDILRSTFKDSTMKLIWILIIIFAPVIGMLIYLIMGKSTKAYPN